MRFGFARLLTFLFAVAVTGPALAQELPATKVAVIDMEMIMEQSKAGRDILEKRNQYLRTFTDDLKAQEQSLRAREQDLLRQRAILSPEAFNAKRQKFQQDITEYQQLAEGRQQALETSFRTAVTQLNRTVVEITAAVAEDRGANLVLTRQQVAFFDDSLDLTPLVLTRLDKKLESVPFPEPTPASAGNSQ